MKQIKKFGYVSAALLASTIAFSACSSDSDVVSGGNTSGAEVTGETVKTQFAINVPYGSSNSSNAKGTRMAEDITQADGTTFNGIDNMRLFSFAGAPESNTSLNNTALGSTNDAYSKDSHRRLYKNIEIPVGTTDFLLYGRASRNSNGSAGNSYKFEYGYLGLSDSYNKNNVNVSDLTFQLDKIAPNADFSANTDGKAILAQLTKVLQSSADVIVGGVKTETRTWSSLTGTSPEIKNLQELYKKFSSLTAGSASSVVIVLDRLISQIGEDLEDKPLSAQIVQNATEAKAALTGNQFPLGLDLPEGVAKIKYVAATSTEGPKFVFDNSAILGNDANLVDYKSITYPASLAYFVNTKAMVTDQELNNTNQLPVYEQWTAKDPSAAWTAVASTSGFAEGAVQGSTHTVGLKNPLQYAVANLKLSVKCKSSVLKDNAHEIEGENVEDADVNVPSSGYPITAVLVGGQPSVVGWNFEPTANATFDYTIYDNQINDNGFAASTTSDDKYNYTLVLDNKNNGGNGKGEANIVYVTIELRNEGKEFCGKTGLVPNGSTFYLVGALDLSKVSESDKNGVDHIFVKDHTTKATFSISSLKNAYNCIPDLRSTELSLGLAVDLKWENGIDFGTIDIE